MARLERDAQRICARFGLRYRVLEPERANVKSRYGVCFSDGTIRIRLRHATTGRPLKYSSLVSTLCHELAHLKHFNHGLRFRAYNAQILEWCRSEGIYRPGLPAEASPGRATQKRPKSTKPANPTQVRQRSKTGAEVRPGGAVGPVQGTLAIFATERPEPRPPKTRTKKKAEVRRSAQLELF